MKKQLCFFLVSFFVIFGAFSSNVFAAEKSNMENKVYVDVDEDTINLENGKTFVLENGATITAHKAKDGNFVNDLRLMPPPNGKWDYLGYSYFSHESSVFSSTGGDLRIEIYLEKYTSGIPYILELREQDTILSFLVKRISIESDGRWIIDVRGWPDGDNEKAEFFLRKLTYPGVHIMTSWYD